MLRLVHPAPEGQGPVTSKRRRSTSLRLTPDEVRHLAASLQNLRRAFGTWSCLADAMGIRESLLSMAGSPRKGKGGSPALALRAAKVAGMSVEAVLSGKLTAAGQCEACGARIGQGRVTA